MKILVISLYYEPDRCQSNGPIVRSLCEDWAAAGHEVTVLTSFPHYNCPSVWPEYRGRLFQRDRVGRVRVLRSFIYVPATRSAAGRILNYLSFNVSSTLAGLFSGSHDVIFVMSPPLTIGLTGIILGSISGAPSCYNVQDIWPEAAVRLGQLRGRRLTRFFEWLERLIYRHSRRIFVISDDFRSNLMGKGVPEEKIVVLPNFVDTDFMRPLPRENDFARRHGLDGRFVALYAGNLGLSQGLEVILEAAERLRNRPELLWVIAGQGACRESLMAEAARRGLDSVIFLPFQPESEVPWLYASCDLALIPLRSGISGNSVPCKTWSIMAAGRPYIAGVDPGSSVWRLTEEAGCGSCVPPEDGEALALAVEAAMSSPETLRRQAERGREHAVRYYSRPAITGSYRRHLEECAAVGHRGRSQGDDAR